MKLPEKLPAKLGGVLLSALLLAAAAAAGLYLPRAMAEYEDARQQHELGIYEMNAVSLGNHAEDDTGERMERIREDFRYSFPLEKGLNLDAADAAGYGESFLAGLRQDKILPDSEVAHYEYIPQLKAREDGSTMIVWETHTEAVSRADGRFYMIDLTIDDTTGAVLSFSGYCQFAGLAGSDQWNGSGPLQLSKALAERIRQQNGFAAAQIYEEETEPAYAPHYSYYFYRYRVCLTDQAGESYEFPLTVEPYNLTFNLL